MSIINNLCVRNIKIVLKIISFHFKFGIKTSESIINSYCHWSKKKFKFNSKIYFIHSE